MKKIYDWCRVKCTRVEGAFALMLPKRISDFNVKIEWLGRKTKNTILRTLSVMSMMLFFCPGIIRIGGGVLNKLKIQSFSGTYTTLSNGEVHFLSSGTVVFSADCYIDIFMVGGGGGGARHDGDGAGGGGGGYTNTVLHKFIQAGVSYTIIIGAGGAKGAASISNGSRGGTTIAFTYQAAGGYGGEHATSNTGKGGNGGSGGGSYWLGVGGSNGSAGGRYDESHQLSVGQGTTTRAFAELQGDLFAGGGGSSGAAGGQGGGGSATNAAAKNGVANTGGGGAGNTEASCGNGGSGIAIIRLSTAA